MLLMDQRFSKRYLLVRSHFFFQCICVFGNRACLHVPTESTVIGLDLQHLRPKPRQRVLRECIQLRDRLERQNFY